MNFGHRRLSVIDIENGKQPMSYKFNDNTYTIVYNGQIYNTYELRKVLEFNGFKFNRSLRYRNPFKSIYLLWKNYL